MLNIDRCGSCLTRSSFSILAWKGSVGVVDRRQASLPGVPSCIFSLNAKNGLRRLSIYHLWNISGFSKVSWGVRSTHVVVIAMWTVLVALFVESHVFSERLFAFLADENHLCGFLQGVR